MAVVVPIISTFDAKGIQRAVRDFKRLEGAGQKSTFALRTMDSAVSTGLKNLAKFGGIAVAGLGAVGFALAKGAMTAQAEQARLGQILKTTGAATDEQVKSLIAQANALEKVGVASAGSIITAQSQLATFDLQFETIQKLTPAIADYVIAEKGASASAEDFKSMTNGLAQALNGQFGALTRSGFVLDDTTKALISNGTEAERAAAIVDVLSSTYGGFNEATGKTAEGRLIMLKNSLQTLRNEIGDRLIPQFQRLVDFMQSSVVPFVENLIEVFDQRGLSGVMQEVGGTFVNFVESGGKVKDIVLALTTAIVALKLVTIAATLAQTLFNVSLLANPIGIVIAAIIAVGVAVVAAYLRFETFRTVVNAVINAVIGAVEFLANTWVRAINAVIDVINTLNSPLRLLGINIPIIGQVAEVSFGRVGAAAKKAAQDVRVFSTGVDDLQDGAAAGIPGATGFKKVETSASGAGKAVQSAADKLKEYVKALQGVTSDQKELTKATNDTKDAQRSLANATEGVRIAQAQFNLVTGGYSRESKKAQDAQRGLEESGRRLRDATLSQEDAVRKVTKAEQVLADLRSRTADPESVASAERNLVKSKFDVEEANFRVIEAEKELAELRSKPGASPTEIRRAEIALQEAKFRVLDSINGVRDAERDLNSERDQAPSADELAEAERNLEAAKRELEDSIRDQKDATIEQAVAQAELNEILNGATEGSDAYREAIESLNEAKEKEAEAIDKVAAAFDRERESVLNLIEAQRELNRLRSITPAGIVARASRVLSRQAGIPLPSQVGVTPFANGGIVMRPTLGMVGEAGPEAIIPLSRAGALGSNISITVNAGMGANGPEIGDAIVEALRRWQFRNGALVGAAQPLKAA